MGQNECLLVLNHVREFVRSIWRVVFKAEEWENYPPKRLSLLNITWTRNILEETEKPKDFGDVLDTSLIHKHYFIETSKEWCPKITSLLVNEFLSFWIQVCAFHLLTKEAKPSEYNMEKERIGRHWKTKISWTRLGLIPHIQTPLKQRKNNVPK